MILKDFLVQLGFKLDASQERRFNDFIGKATKKASELALGVEGAAVAFITATEKMANGLERLAYAAQRTRSGVGDLRAFRSAVEQAGGSAQSAMASAENMAAALRNNPGMIGYLEKLGVSTRNAKGQIRGAADLVGDLGQKLKQQYGDMNSSTYFIGQQMAGQFGIDPDTLQAVQRTGYLEWMRKFREENRAAGIDQDAAAKGAAHFMQNLRDVLFNLDLFTTRVFNLVNGPATKLLDWFKQASDATGGWSTTLVVLVSVLAAALTVLDPVLVAVLALAGGLVAAWSGTGPFSKALHNLADAFDTLWTALSPVRDALGDLFGPIFKQVASGSFKLVLGAMNGLADRLREIAQAYANLMGVAQEKPNGTSMGAAAHATAQGSPGAPGSTPSGATASGTLLGKLAEIAARFSRLGWSKEDSIAWAANAIRESGGDPHAYNSAGGGRGAHGLFQHRGSRLDDFKRWSGGRDLKDASEDEQVRFVDYEARRGAYAAVGRALAMAKTVAEKAAIINDKFEANGLSGEGARRAALATSALNHVRLGGEAVRNVSVQQNVQVKVDGAGNPREVARHIVGEHNRALGNAVRNAKAALA